MTTNAKDSPPGWLIATTGETAGTRYRLRTDRVRIGRDPDNDIIPEGPRAGIVSKSHAEILWQDSLYTVRDLKSRNGTLINGARVEQSELKDGDQIQLGSGGPEFEFREGTKAALDETLVASNGVAALPGPESSTDPDLERELQQAVSQARAARGGKGTGQTLMIMRRLLATKNTIWQRRLKIVVLILTIPLIGLSVYAYRIHRQLNSDMDQIDREIRGIESALSETRDPEEIEALIEELESHQTQAREIQRSVLYQLGLRDRETDFIDAEIQRLMAELGAYQYSIPAPFRERVRHYIEHYQTANRRHIQQALGEKREVLEEMRSVFGEANLPPDLAFITVVESAFRWSSVSPNGAAGPWQFVPATARAFGLAVNDEIDERFDVVKSTRAAALYVRRLISEFGTGNSAMLALAAYNLGPTRVRRVVRRIEDPIKQRSFWYLYRKGTLPGETREYIPKIVAVIIILRNPEAFGFSEDAFF